jgi:serine/threonine protein kinase
VYAQPLSEPGERVQLSSDGGTDPLWARSGEIFFLRDDELRVVETRLGSSAEFDAPRPLFRFPIVPTSDHDTQTFDVTADGKRILAVTNVPGSRPSGSRSSPTSRANSRASPRPGADGEARSRVASRPLSGGRCSPPPGPPRVSRMTVAPGTRLGPYEITAPLGEGGMGEVWRARDTKLGREVAIKVLPAAFADDAERLARFRREAQILASLGHSGIASIYGLEEGQGILALAMELAPGEELAERLKRGPLPVEEALAVARQIAEALEEAHGKGIVHRDLKPANVKITHEGKVKVLDFGLAKAFSGEASGSGLSSDSSRSPTMTGQATQAGVILGTAAYMSPEQARGKPVDKRADIWSFGVVLFEMLSGRRLFAGETVSDTLAAVLRADPDWALLPPGLPPTLADLLRRCLERDPHRRLHDVADARIVLDDLLEGRVPVSPAAGPTVAPALSARTRWTRRAAVFLLGALAMTPFLWSMRRAPAPATDATQPTSFRQLTFLAGASPRPRSLPTARASPTSR